MDEDTPEVLEVELTEPVELEEVEEDQPQPPEEWATTLTPEEWDERLEGAEITEDPEDGDGS